jgi:serine/threonine protein kinase
MDDYMLHAAPGEEAVPQDIMRPEADENCIPMADWQTNSFPNCNAFHEMDLPLATDESPEEVSMELLGTGWFRSTWKWSVKGDQSVVLKTLRLDREFYDEYFELHRRDAVAMERLAHSPFVMNIYGYCGQSALNELADFNWDSMEKFNRNMRGRKATPALNFLKLQLSSSVAVGIAHVHEIDDRPSMVHYDVNPRNVAMVGGGRPKLNDFNTAEFLRYNPKTNKTCGFRGRLHEPWWRAPEEVAIGNSNVLDEKVDVYALGNVLFHILTTKSPRGKLKRERMEEVRQVVLDGVPPEMDPEFAESTDPALVAIRTAIEMCYEPDPVKRPSSRQIAEVLMETLVELRSKFKKSR